MKRKIFITLLTLVFVYGCSTTSKNEIGDIMLVTSQIEIDISNDKCISRTKDLFRDRGFEEVFIIDMESGVTSKNNFGMFYIECMSEKNLAYVSIAHTDQDMYPVTSFVNALKESLSK